MKKVLFVAVAGLLLAACNNVEQFRAPIESLTTQWDSTTNVVTNFATLLDQEIANAQAQAAGFTLSEDMMKKLKEEQKARLAELGSQYQQESQGLNAIKSDLEAFVQSWTEKSNTLTSLKDGLANKKLDENVEATISELQTAVSDAGTQVASWTERLNTVKTKLQDLAKQQGQALGTTSSSLIGG